MNKIIFIFTLLTLLVTSSMTFQANAEAPERKMTLKETVVYYAYKNGVDPILALSMMECESKGKQNTIGDYNRAIGIFQYWKDTWERHSKAYGKTLDINNPEHQAELATWAIANGMGREWTSYRAIKNGGSYTFFYKLEQREITVYCSLQK